jgi:hypothetical protein
MSLDATSMLPGVVALREVGAGDTINRGRVTPTDRSGPLHAGRSGVAGRLVAATAAPPLDRGGTDAPMDVKLLTARLRVGP